ncbi:hypothetical protein SAMN04488527_12116 [Aliiroseovarius crassostreae]|uniref:Flagellar biosynthesis protein FlgN n=1 Tax=Aliiroseovarius crassostreae TaxID=154981 RepID=A0A0N8IC41_9RHOB|nr:hypothetical protein [Aliiroseovarius crassostreae]KPN64851.1 hypothetical protein AKJ29_06370 [Aliiroseovarius crassostreae]SFU83711.1 hypothetical protein SAMN04488527_12116 [Aliiroseovarius crassostreae]
MALFKRISPAQALNNLLDQERNLLLSGQLVELAKLGPEKERLFRLLPSMALSRTVIEQMRQKAEHNQALLLSANKGLRTVSRRLELLRNQKSQLRTYDAGGQSQDLARPSNKFEHRA